MGKPGGVCGIDDGHGAPESIHLAVVAGEEPGDEGVGGEPCPNCDQVVKELPLKRFEFGAVEPGPGDCAE